MRIDLIVFDFDGTLFDTSKDLTEAINFALNKVGLPPISRKKVWSFTGDGTALLVKRVLDKKSSQLYNTIFNHFIGYYSSHYANYTKPIEGAKTLLEKLREKKMVILSNKYKKFINRILYKFNMYKYFSAVYGKESFNKSKPDPLPLLYIMNQAKVINKKTIFVGDSLNDVLISKKANVKCFIIPSGVTPIEKIKELKPFRMLKSIKELENFVE